MQVRLLLFYQGQMVLFTVSLRGGGWFLSPLPEASVLSRVSAQGLARGGGIHYPSFKGGLFFCPCLEQGLIGLRSLFHSPSSSSRQLFLVRAKDTEHA